MTKEELFQLLKKCLPPNLAFRTEGGLEGKTEITGTFDDVLTFVHNVYSFGGEIGSWETEQRYQEIVKDLMKLKTPE
jgi:hypothetical protein